MGERDSSAGHPADLLSTRDDTSPGVTFAPLVYGGGPIVPEPELVSLFWGPFSEIEISGMLAYLREFVRYLSGARYTPEGQEPAVWQYGVTGGTVGASCFVCEAPPQSTDGEVRAQLVTLQRKGCLPAFSPERIFLVFTRNIRFPNYGAPPPDGFCAYHDQIGPGQYYALCPFPAIGGCGSGSPKSGWQSLTCHEILEAATDPAGSGGWTASNEEGADFCNWQEVTLPFGTVQQFEDNREHGCSVFTPAAVRPDPVEHGVLGDLGPIGPGDAGWYTAWEPAGGGRGTVSLWSAAPLPPLAGVAPPEVTVTPVRSPGRENDGRQVTVTVRNQGRRALRARLFYTRSVNGIQAQGDRLPGSDAETGREVFGDTGRIAAGEIGWYTAWDDADTAFGRTSRFTAVPLPRAGSRGASVVTITDVQSVLRPNGGRQVTVTVRNNGPEDARARIYFARIDGRRIPRRPCPCDGHRSSP